MSDFPAFSDIGVSTDGFVATIEIQRPPHNFFDYALIRQIADAMEAIDADPGLRCAVLCAQGKSFCAGANFSSDGSSANQSSGVNPTDRTNHLYFEAVRLFAARTPIVGAIQGAAIGGGLGLALVPDFRVAAPEARFAANFTRLGFHPGFGLTHTLPSPGRAATCCPDVLYQSQDPGRGGGCVGTGRHAFAAWRRPKHGAGAGGRDCREFAAGRGRNPGHGPGRAG